MFLNKHLGPWSGHGLAVLAGALGVLGFAPYGFWPAVLLSGLALLGLIDGLAPRQAWLRGFFWGLGFYGVGVNWVHVSIHEFGGAPLPLALLFAAILGGYMALYTGLLGYALQRWFVDSTAVKYLLAFPSLWLAQEAFRGWFATGFPWLFWGYSQTSGPLAGIAPLLGVYGISLALALCLGSLYFAVRSHRYRYLLTLPFIAALAVIGHRLEWTQPKGEALSIALVQGNIPQEAKWNPDNLYPTIEKYSALTREHWDVDLIVWPEAALPALRHQISDVIDSFDATTKAHGSSLLMGLPTADFKNRRYYNSVVALGAASGQYHKQHLVPFGEYVPFEALLRGLITFFDLPMSAFAAGEAGVVLKTPKATLNPAVCYEIAYPLQVAEVDADLLLTVSNDAWFGHSIGPHQHMQIAQMRALELGRPLIRSTNNGITALTDYRGEIRARLPQFQEGVLSATVQPRGGLTPFAQTGGWPVFGLMAALFAWAWCARKAKA